MTASAVTALQLSIAPSRNPRTQALLDGEIVPQGIRLIGTAIHGSEMFWRQLKFSGFDVSDMSLSSLMAAAVRGGATEWVAIPVLDCAQPLRGIRPRQGRAGGEEIFEPSTMDL